MRDARFSIAGATAPSPSPLAGEGKGEGALQNMASRSILSRPLIRPSAEADGHLLPRGEKGRAALSANGVPATFFWINLAQRRVSLS